MLLILLPWTARNYFAMDGFVLTATNGGINLLIGSGPGATGRHYRADRSAFSDTSEITVYRESIDLAIEHVLSDPQAWVRLLPVKFFYLWAAEGGWAGLFEDASDGFQRHLQPWVRVIWWSAQLHWAVVLVVTAASVVTRPINYWLSFPAILLPAMLLYWTAFHMPFFGTGRFHAQMIPIIVVIAIHLLEGDRDWLAWIRPFRRGNDSPDVIAYTNADKADDPSGQSHSPLLRDNSEQKVVIPSCSFAFALDGGFDGSVLFEQVERHVSDHRQILRGIAFSDTTFIFTE